MHMGNIFAALMSYASAKSQGGRWILRIEDLDRQRCRPEFATQIVDDLLWLGLQPDEGPGAPAVGLHGPYCQSLRDGVYAEAFESLRAKGLVYECFCRRQDLMAASAPHASDGHAVYPRTCLRLAEAEKEALRAARRPAWRLRLPDEKSSFADGHYGVQEAHLARERGDIILRRADGNFAYQLAVVTDDALMGVNEVVRARDLMAASHEQAFLLRTLGHPVPHYSHFPLLMAPDGTRLSKRDRALAMDKIRLKTTPDELIGLIAWLVGFQGQWHAMPLGEFVETFRWDDVPHDDITVDASSLF